MDIVLLLAALAFLAAAIWSAITKAWPLALLAAGLFLLTLNMSGLITS
ncbi:hypothetical protein [Nonomuraea typhae]|uniref:Uncharacterized protein n=1 Tax=Nonomuraea typhae TaxID=2603600 RepID=A0ABW7YLY0_9ACTN